jgi:hypothetical protein
MQIEKREQKKSMNGSEQNQWRQQTVRGETK